MATEETTKQSSRENEARPGDQQHDAFDKMRFGIAIAITGLALLILFLGNFVYVFGSTFQQTSRNHAYTIVAVNYDVDGPVWQSITGAYDILKSNEFATLVFEDPSNYPGPESLVDAVREQHYWGAIYVTSGASARLSNATKGQSSSYDNKQAVAYVWNEIRYPAISYSVVRSAILQLQTVSISTYQRLFAESFMENIILADNRETAFRAFLSPFDAAEINIRRAPQASKAFYNTISMAMAIIQQNLFLITFHSIASQFGLFSRSFTKSAPWALGAGLIYTFLAGLITTASIYAFREDWEITGGQFMVTWMAMWLVNHIYYQLIDGTLFFVPIQYYSLIIITFVFISITTTIFPLESSAGFYRWGLSLPTLHVFQILLDIWCNSSAKIYQSLPILFAWWVVSAAYAISGLLVKCRSEAKKPETTGSSGSTSSQADNPSPSAAVRTD